MVMLVGIIMKFCCPSPCTAFSRTDSRYVWFARRKFKWSHCPFTYIC